MYLHNTTQGKLKFLTFGFPIIVLFYSSVCVV